MNRSTGGTREQRRIKKLQRHIVSEVLIARPRDLRTAPLIPPTRPPVLAAVDERPLRREPLPPRVRFVTP
eukprot:COSAG01_NODE_294_length_19294_cov_35.559312_3_plen_70_part_00